MNKNAQLQPQSPIFFKWTFKSIFEWVLVVLLFGVLLLEGCKFKAVSNSLFIDQKVQLETPLLLDLVKQNREYPKDTYSVFSHGRSGQLYIEGAWLDAPEISQFLKERLGTAKNLHIYGCEFAKGKKGKAAVVYLQQTLGVEIAASTNITGQDGDWVLEMQTKNQTTKNLSFPALNISLQDTDNDGVDDAVDIDDDNDGVLDATEGCYSGLYTTDLSFITVAGTGFIFHNGGKTIYFNGGDAGYVNSVHSPGFLSYGGSSDFEISFSITGTYPYFGSGRRVYIGINETGTNTTNGTADIDYAFYINKSTSEASIYENGINVGSAGVDSAINLTQFAIKKEGTLITYWVNNSLVYTSDNLANGADYYVDSSFYGPSSGVTIKNFEIVKNGLIDMDGDGIINCLDLDSDNDGIPDNIEAQSTVGYIASSGIDSDGDGLNDAYDTDNGGTAITPVNTDGTGGADYLDLDADDDGVFDIVESGSNLIDANTDGMTDGTVGINGFDNSLDNGDTYADVNGSFDATQTDNFTDVDSDVHIFGGDLDYRDILFGTDSDNDGVLNSEDIDDDADGIVDADEIGDTDGDGLVNSLDLDSDNDGIPDNIESQSTVGYISPFGTDIDGDGLDDAYDSVNGPASTFASVATFNSILFQIVNTEYIKFDQGNTAEYSITYTKDDGSIVNFTFLDSNTYNNIPTIHAALDAQFANSELSDLFILALDGSSSTRRGWFHIQALDGVGLDVSRLVITNTFLLFSDPSKTYDEAIADETVSNGGYTHSYQGMAKGIEKDNVQNDRIEITFENGVALGNVADWTDWSVVFKDAGGGNGHSVSDLFGSLSNFNQTASEISVDGGEGRVLYLVKDPTDSNIVIKAILDLGSAGDRGLLKGGSFTFTDTAGEEVVARMPDPYYVDVTGSGPYNDGMSIIPLNTDGTGDADFLDVDADDDGVFDIVESGSGLDDVNADGMTDGDVGNNGLDNALDSGDTFSNVRGVFDATQADNFTDTDADVLTFGDVDYRDVFLSGTAMITQMYQSATDAWIEITNVHASNTIEANAIQLCLFSNSTGDQTGNTPSTSYIYSGSLAPGASILIHNSAASISNTHAGAVLIVDNTMTSFAGANDLFVLSSEINSLAYEKRYDVLSNITNSSSYVRNDNILYPNKDFNSSQWTVFVDDGLDPDADPPERHALAPLLSEITTANTDANIQLGLHRNGATTRTGSVWNNGFPDPSRYVIIAENLEQSTVLNAKKLQMDLGANLTINNNVLVVTDSIVNNGTIRMSGTSQIVQTHVNTSQVSGSGNLQIDQLGTLASIYRFNYWSAPVVENGNATYRIGTVLKDGTIPTSSSSEITAINFVGGYDGAKTSPISIASYWLYSYTNGAWNATGNTGVLNRGDGYLLKGPGVVQNYTFVGSPNDGLITTAIGASTSKLIGNPYPSALDATKFIRDNSDVIDGTLYFWEHTGELGTTGTQGHNSGGYLGGYSTRNLTMGIAANTGVVGTGGLGNATYRAPGLDIAVAQGFFVGGSEVGGTIVFNNAQRKYQTINGSNSLFFKGRPKVSKKTALPIVKLGLDYTNTEAQALHRQIGISFKEGNTFGYESGYDSEIYDLNTQDDDMYWNFGEEKNYVIAGVEAFNIAVEIPISLQIKSENSVTIRLDAFENIQGPICLFDALTNTFTDLKKSSGVQLNLAKGIYSNRFYLSFKEATLEVEDFKKVPDVQLYYSKATNSLCLQAKNEILKKITLYNIMGQQCKQWILKPTDEKKLALIVRDIPMGVYMVKVETSVQTVSKKLIVY